MDELLKIQQELKVPKNQFNSFGNFKYRSAEDILEAVKPLLKKHGCVMTMSDEVVNLGDRYYVKANAVISNNEGKGISVSAFARESEEKKGMDSAQITGSASSYARKYALNGLFAIDDNADPDTMDNSKAKAKTDGGSKMVTMKQGKYLQSLGMKTEDIKKLTSLEATAKIKELKEE